MHMVNLQVNLKMAQCFGLLEYDNGSYYKGEFKDGAYKIGWGTFGADGNKYIGYFVPWKGRTGQGSFIFQVE